MIRTRYKEEEIEPWQDLSIFLFPLTGFTLFVYLALAILFSYLVVISTASILLAVRALFTWMVCVCGLLHYGFVILEFTSRGIQEAPRFTAGMLFAHFDSRLFKELLFLALLVAVVLAVKVAAIQFFLITVSLLIFPAATAYIGVEGSMSSAVNPLRLYQFIRHMGLGIVTVKLVGIEVALGMLLFAGIQTATTAPAYYLMLATGMVVYLILMLFRCIGVLLHCRREAFGLATDFSPEQEEMERLSQIRLKRGDVFFDLHGLSQRGNTKAAWQMLEAALKEDEYESEAEYFHRISQWDNPSLLFKMAQGYIERLLKRKDIRTAWHIFEHCHSRSAGKFQLISGKSVMQLCRHAYSNDHAKLAVEQLGHFEKDFPKHPGLQDALYLAVQICCADLNDFKQGRIYLRTIKEKFPDAPQEERYQTLHDLLVT